MQHITALPARRKFLNGWVAIDEFGGAFPPRAGGDPRHFASRARFGGRSSLRR